MRNKQLQETRPRGPVDEGLQAYGYRPGFLVMGSEARLDKAWSSLSRCHLAAALRSADPRREFAYYYKIATNVRKVDKEHTPHISCGTS